VNDERQTPDYWQTVKLPEVVYFQEGPGLRKFQYRDSGIPFLNIRTLAEERVDKTKCQFLDAKEVAEKYPHFLVETGDIICSSSGTIGKTATIQETDKPLLLNTSIIRFRPLDPAIITRGYIHAYLKSQLFLRQAHKASTGSAQVNFGPSHLRNFTIPLPPLAEQKRIVAKIEELFSELEAGEESLRLARRQLATYRQSLLKQAFEGKLTAKWREQNPDKLEAPENLLARIQDARRTSPDGTSRRSSKRTAQFSIVGGLAASLPSLPPSWKWTALGNLSHLVTKGSSPRWQGFDYISDPKGVLFVTSENVRSGFLDLSRPKYLEVGFNDIQPASVLRDGDVLLNIVGASIGRAATFRGATLANINQAVSLIRTTDFLDDAFLTYHLNSSRIYQLITAKAVDVARANFSLADVNEIPVPLCSLPEQREIVRLLDEQFEVIERNEREIDAALQRSEALRQSILHRAFTGKLVSPACRQAGKTPAEFPQPKPGKWWVYVLQCNDGSYYKGFTDNLPERWLRHLSGHGAKWTAQHPPVELYYWEECWSEADAIARERYLKSGVGREWFLKEVVGKAQEYEPATELLARLRTEKQSAPLRKPRSSKTKP
jgi:type I restriction enzyme S subunit